METKAQTKVVYRQRKAYGNGWWTFVSLGFEWLEEIKRYEYIASFLVNIEVSICDWEGKLFEEGL